MNRLRPILFRLLQTLPVALMVVIINFFLMKCVPGDLADVIAGEAGAATPEFMAQLRAQYGTDQPVAIQFYHYIEHVFTLNLGWSWSYNIPVSQLIIEKIPATLLLMTVSLFIAVVAGVVLGVIASVTRYPWLERLIGALATLGFSLPVFWVGLMVVVFFTVKLGWLPSGGYQSLGKNLQGMDKILDISRHLIMPAGCLAFSYLALYIRLMQESVLSVAMKDFIRTARAKGCSRFRLIWRHLIPNAFLPVVTLTGIQFGAMLSGSVTIETVFSWPGLGQLALSAVSNRDINLLLGILFVSSMFVVLVNLVTELIYAALDPRVRSGGNL